MEQYDIQAIARRVLQSRMRVMCSFGFYGILLSHMDIALNPACRSISCTPKKVVVSPDYLKSLTDSELDFVMMHEVMHLALRHASRASDRDARLYDLACDIVVNSNIMTSCGIIPQGPVIHDIPHLTPSGDEGCKYTAEQVYDLLKKASQQTQSPSMTTGAGTSSGSGSSSKSQGGSSKGSSKGKDKGRGQGNSSSKANDSNDPGEGGDSDSSGEGGSDGDGKDSSGSGNGRFDDHTGWGEAGGSSYDDDKWQNYVMDAAEAAKAREYGGSSRGTVPLGVERLIEEIRRPRIDWRVMLNDFLQEEICDYTFMPPDRRFDGPFFLPDYNDRDYYVRDVLFMIDASGSISNKLLDAAYSEVKGALEQFDGKLQGQLGFFDAAVTPPVPFDDVSSLMRITPRGGGGTDFGIIFDYALNKMSDPPVSIIILTDGYAPIPDESVAGGIPVIWLICNEHITPSWGKVARIDLSEY
ncbi:MAG: VWA-like domain-containing protein [Clostridia bacterium]|nr:VWA-like domain-containing protein [Clostridia bacterium]